MEHLKGLILSGGKGTRLRPITHTSAKQLVPVANKPVLFYGLEAMVEAGIRDIGIVVGDTHAEIRAAVGDGSRWGASITYIAQDAPRGLAHAVLISEPFIRRVPFVMYLGDNLLNRGITQFVERFERERPAAQILLTRVPDPQMFGVAELRRHGVRLVEKPTVPKSDLALVGVYMFTRGVHVRQGDPARLSDELEITDAIQDLSIRARVRPHIVEGWWKDTGKLEDMLEANRLILDTIERRVEGELVDSRVEGGRDRAGRDSSGPSSAVRSSSGGRPADRLLRRPVHRGRRAVTIQNAEVEHSILLAGSVVRDLAGRMESLLLGRNVTSAATGASPGLPVHGRRQLGGRHPEATR